MSRMFTHVFATLVRVGSALIGVEHSQVYHYYRPVHVALGRSSSSRCLQLNSITSASRRRFSALKTTVPPQQVERSVFELFRVGTTCVWDCLYKPPLFTATIN